MEKNGLIINANSAEIISMVNPKEDKKRLYHVEGRKEFINYSQSPVVANETYTWTIENDLIPLVFWVYEANVQSNKTFKWAIVNPEGLKIFDVTLTASNFSQLGNTLYWVFPLASVKSGSKAYFQSNVNLDGVNIICTFCRIDQTISGVLSSSYP